MLLKRFAETNDNDGRRVRILLNCDIELCKETMEYEMPCLACKRNHMDKWKPYE